MFGKEGRAAHGESPLRCRHSPGDRRDGMSRSRSRSARNNVSMSPSSRRYAGGEGGDVGVGREQLTSRRRGGSTSNRSDGQEACPPYVRRHGPGWRQSSPFQSRERPNRGAWRQSVAAATDGDAVDTVGNRRFADRNRIDTDRIGGRAGTVGVEVGARCRDPGDQHVLCVVTSILSGDEVLNVASCAVSTRACAATAVLS